MQDIELLREYVKSGSEPAFTELVKRYIDFVHSTARRQLAGADAAEEVTQAVFCILVRKANNLTHLPTLGGWLYRTTCFTAAKARRSEQRRRQREHQAATMNSNEPTTTEAWEDLSPLLDEGLNQLAETDRLAVLLRFFQQRPMREVGETIGISESAAKMRVSRSLERLRDYFTRRGFACTISALGVLLTEKSVQAAPVPLTGKVTRASLSGIAAPLATSSSILQLLKIMTRINAKTVLFAGLVIVVAFTTGLNIYSHEHRSTLNPKPVSASTAGSAAELNQATQELRSALHNDNSNAEPGAPSYFIEGTISVANAPAYISNTMGFHLMANECRWSIELLANPSTSTNIHSFRQDFDGTNLIHLAIFNGFGSGRNDSSGGVELNKVPNGRTGSHIGKIWLAYASQCYFAELTNSQVEPFWFLPPEQRDRHLTVPARWKLSDDMPRLPASVDFFDDGLNRMTKSGQPIKRLPPFDNGYLEAQFSVNSWTNLGEMRFPYNFTYTHFMPRRDAQNSNDTDMTSIAVGQLTSVRNLQGSDKWPSIETNSPYLEDRRISSVNTKVNSAIYALTNQPLPNAADLIKKRQFN